MQALNIKLVKDLYQLFQCYISSFLSWKQVWFIFPLSFILLNREGILKVFPWMHYGKVQFLLLQLLEKKSEQALEIIESRNYI